MPDEHPCTFCCEGERLHGVLHLPREEPRRAVLMLHGWAGYRIGPGRLLVTAARRLARRGVAVLRFDFRGRGESDGDAERATIATMTADARTALAFLRERLPRAALTPLGVCSGGEVALGLLREPGVDSAVFWSAPILSGQAQAGQQARRAAQQAGAYWRKLWQRDTWRKLLGGHVSWGLVRRALLGPRAAPSAASSPPHPPLTLSGFQGPLLFVYGGADPDAASSQDHYRRRVEGHGLIAHFHIVEGANHNFYAREWQREVLGVTEEWLVRLEAYPTGVLRT